MNSVTPNLDRTPEIGDCIPYPVLNREFLVTPRSSAIMQSMRMSNENGFGDAAFPLDVARLLDRHEPPTSDSVGTVKQVVPWN